MTFPDAHWQPVDDAVACALSEGAFPGAVLLAGQGGHILFHRAYGMADIFSRRKMAPDTVFDLASLTKPLATTIEAMHLVDRGALDVDRPIADILPAFAKTGAALFTSRMLLNHTAGFPAWLPFFQMLRDVPAADRRARMQHLLAAVSTVSAPGVQTRYSDVGFLLLEWMLETIGGETLAGALEEKLFLRLGAPRLFFPCIPAEHTGPYAAGQLCPWRCRLICGEVDDENAAALGGAAGHAGLFGTAEGVHGLIAALWRCYAGPAPSPVFSRETARAFMTPPADGRRALGFDIPSGPTPGCGRLFRRPTIGHLGFTGVSFWLELDSGVHIVMLTNRTHPFRFSTGIRCHRPIIHDALKGVIDGYVHPPAAGL